MEQRPSSGSCARCRDSLTLSSVQVDGIWYCGTACAEGRPGAAPRRARVPESRLHAVPRRFFRARKPNELRSKPRR